MRFKLATAIGIGALLVAVSAAPANAATNTITVGSTGTVTNRILISVSVTIVCDPLPDTPEGSAAQVTVQQANGQQISGATGGVGSFTGPATPFLTCDGVTANTAVIQALPASGSPFHGGGAVVTATWYYDTGVSCGPGCFETTNSESGSTIATVSLRG